MHVLLGTSEMMKYLKSDRTDWMQWVSQILYPAGIYLAWIYLEGIFCVWNTSRFSSLWLRTSFHVENLSSGEFRMKFLLSCAVTLASTNIWKYVWGERPTLQSFPPRSLHNYSMYLNKSYEHNIWGSHILECICPHKILIKRYYSHLAQGHLWRLWWSRKMKILQVSY